MILLKKVDQIAIRLNCYIESGKSTLISGNLLDFDRWINGEKTEIKIEV